MASVNTRSYPDPGIVARSSPGFSLTAVEHNPFDEFAEIAPSIRQVAPTIPDTTPGWISSLFGAKSAPVERAPASTAYPNQLDTYFAKEFQQTYGDPIDGFMLPGSKTKKMSSDDVVEAFGDITGRAFGHATATATTPDERNDIMRNWIASQKSSLSALGFDPHVTIMTPKGDKPVNLAGFYRPGTDTLWFNGDRQDAVVHEAFHRGIQKLRDAKILPPEADNVISNYQNGEEMLVRAFKQKYFGDIEKGHGELGDKQVSDAKYLMEGAITGPQFKSAMDALEGAASKEISNRKPRGPR